ncbi:HMG domain-containing protein 3 [Rhinophrynus dorsalis]
MEAPFDGTEVTVVSEEVDGNYLCAKPPVKKKKYKSCAEGDTVKKPRSAYLLYYYDIYLKVQQEIPHLPQSEINKKISESWKLLSVAEKSFYLERAKLEKEGLDSNITSCSSSMVSDVPGFRKILPRADYFLIPKRCSNEDKVVQQHLELCMTQSQGTGPVSSIPTVPQNGGHNVLSVDSGQICISEQGIDLDGLADEGTSFSPVDLVQEVLPGVFSNYSGQDKLSGDIVLDDATLEIGETSPYPNSNVVIEETGGITLARSGLPAGIPQLTVMSIQDAEENCPPAPTTQFIVLPMTNRPTVEKPPSVKLTTKYTRRGRGSCNNPGCSFTYATRHKPRNCPVCNNFLGGKFSSKARIIAEEDYPNSKSGSKSTQENTQAVSQLLHASPPTQEEEWEEVIVSDIHVVPHKVDKKSSDSTECSKKPRDIPEAESLDKMEYDDLKTEAASSAEQNKAVSHISSPTSTNKLQEKKGVAKYRATTVTPRPIRAILPAPVSPNKIGFMECTDGKLAILKTEPQNSIGATGLKPSTLKQLGHSVVTQPIITQELTVKSDRQENVSQPQLKVVTESFPSYKNSCPVALDLGLATQRGRGKCKNPFCSFMYTNRHKPKTCPICGCNLKDKGTNPFIQKPVQSVKKMLNVTKPLSPTQKEVQRQSTLQLLRKTVQIPENESELSEVFTLIQELNSSPLVLSNVGEGTVTIEQTSWASFYQSPAVQCLLCGTSLFQDEESSLCEFQGCWLLTANRLQLVSAQIKLCLNPKCLAIHSFNDIYTGLFNVGNKLLVSLDLLFTIRNQLKLGEDPKVSISNILESVQEITGKKENPEVLASMQELLSCGYWAFECLTMRDYNDMICGVCGVAPKVEIAQRNVENTLTLTNTEFTWPDYLTSNEVSMDDFWSTLENDVLEQAAFPSSIPITKFDASIISPFFPPLMRGSMVVNSESYKNLEVQKVPGSSSALVRLIQEGTIKLDQIDLLSREELQRILALCRIPLENKDSVDEMCYALLALSEFVQNGTQIKQPPAHLTGGKVYKVCPHQVICGSKYIVRGENARDHVDLLSSSRHWPPVYVVDMATQVALCADLCYPDLTLQMWGKNQGCFSDPSEPPMVVSCPELLDRDYSVDMMGNEQSIQHPITKSVSRRVVHAVAEQNGTCDPTSRHHSLSLCRELEPYSAIIAAIEDSKTSNIRHNPINFDNSTHYYLYNRLIDFLTSRDIVNRQIHDIVQSCQPGEVVIRDTLYRLGVAQIKTETGDEEEEDEDVIHEQINSM